MVGLIRREVFGILRVCAIAAVASLVLLPFYTGKERLALFTGSGIAAIAGLASSFVSRHGIGKRAGFTGAFLGATFLRFLLSMVGLFVCFYLTPDVFNPAAMSLLLAYLALLAVDTIVLCRAQRMPPGVE